MYSTTINHKRSSSVTALHFWLNLNKVKKSTSSLNAKALVVERLGIVLKVNGENTLFAEKAADPQCTLWIMSQTAESFL